MHIGLDLLLKRAAHKSMAIHRFAHQQGASVSAGERLALDICFFSNEIIIFSISGCHAFAECIPTKRMMTFPSGLQLLLEQPW